MLGQPLLLRVPENSRCIKALRTLRGRSLESPDKEAPAQTVLLRVRPSCTLGLEVVKRDGPWAEVDANGVTIGLNGREPEGTQAEGGPVITFQPEGGLDAAIENLKGKGVEFPAEISEHDWGRLATFKDPDGNDLQLYEPPRS